MLKPELPRKLAKDRSRGTVHVEFARSGIETAWSRENETLLELAEEAGLAPAFGCRSGICGTCKTRIVSGAVEYLDEPLANRGEGEILICCSVPREAPGENKNGERPDVVLDL